MIAPLKKVASGLLLVVCGLLELVAVCLYPIGITHKLAQKAHGKLSR